MRVHRLPPEGQEKLFHFMDNGARRRLAAAMKRSATVRPDIRLYAEDLESTFWRHLFAGYTGHCQNSAHRRTRTV
ncbi:hypothetical protein KCP73_04680 [Salmonella enterica subsp. enterica]|nr:hypothetical protein KCP73_04680 [Salmonella enterica subsp. enterica]